MNGGEYKLSNLRKIRIIKSKIQYNQDKINEMELNNGDIKTIEKYKANIKYYEKMLNDICAE